MLEHILRFTAQPTKAEITAAWERTLNDSDWPGLDRESILAAIDATRR